MIRHDSLRYATSPRRVTWNLNFVWNASCARARARKRTGCSPPPLLSLSLSLSLHLSYLRLSVSRRRFLRSLARSSKKNGVDRMSRMFFAWRDVWRDAHAHRVSANARIAKGEARLTPIRSANRRALRHLVRCNGASHPRGRATERCRVYFGIAREKEKRLVTKGLI